MRTLLLYSRPGCHLCEELGADLAPLLEGRDVALEIVDISGDPELERRYGLRIPVLAEGDVELSSYPLERDKVERHLAAG